MHFRAGYTQFWYNGNYGNCQNAHLDIFSDNKYEQRSNYILMMVSKSDGDTEKKHVYFIFYTGSIFQYYIGIVEWHPAL